MLEQSFLRRLVVIGCHLERAVGPEPLRILREINGFAGRVGACAREDLDLAGGEPHGKRNQVDVLVIIDRGRLTCRAHRHDAIDPPCNLGLNQIL